MGMVAAWEPEEAELLQSPSQAAAFTTPPPCASSPGPLLKQCCRSGLTCSGLLRERWWQGSMLPRDALRRARAAN